ncbi:PREDICTED: transient receptor potential cation channel subfamily M member 5 isoform X2 [Cyprinodon variegatus]|uniref:Transient receptor potential cation channel, subfamily M, member 5 n=1 Tax=Cyprinodon variegatus TaxID=28743 RepID=A0A3Q2FY09_CYPVA|nr:PREDICTED: transient receptor potential cation channel subfamily M member 5 isoform X2 [Cyprinodon variegatus]
MPEKQDTPLKPLEPQTRCLRCGETLEWSEEHSVLLGCSCCSAVDEAIENVARGLANKMEEKTHWAAGRVGDIDFIGSTKTKGKFVRVCSNTDPVLIYKMLTEEWGLSPPHLVVALVGGDELAQMKPWLRDTLRKGLVKAAQSTGAWILTNGLRFGITKHLGQAVRDHSLASTSSKVRVVAIGIAPWNMIHNREALLTAKVDEPAVYRPQDLPHGSVYSLDSNHSHFVLVEEDPNRPGATSEMRVKLLKHISLQRTGYGGAGSFEIPVLCLLVHGEPRILKRMYKGIGNSTPWLILAGSGGVADILVTLMNRGCWDADSVHELLLDTFPNAHHSTDISNWVKLIQKILDHGHLLTVHDPEQESSELDTVILKALVKACKSQSQEAQDFLDELKLAVAWNRVDIAKSDIFNGDVEWKEKPPKGRLFHSQKNLPEFEERCEHPWRDLFLWAVLQNRQQMANYFWAMGPEAVAAALAGCKILKEMARLESEAESARSMKEAKYEQFALDVFGECYSNSEDRAYALLVRRTHCWSKSTVLNLATEADAKSFFAHDGVQALLTKLWWGAMTTDTAISKLVVSFFIPPLIWTNLIKFSEEELDNRDGKKEFVELDSLDTEKALLLTDDDPLDSSPGGQTSQSCATVWWRFLLRRWRRFWSAPVTVFLGNVIMYFAFLCLFTYVLLLDFRPPPPFGPGVPEILLYFWVFTLVLEEIRQSFFTDEEMSILKKFKLYVEDNWNKCDMVAILLFVVGVSCRMSNGTYEAGRTVMAIDFMVFTLRLIHIFAINKQLGPKIIIVERMMKDVFFFLFFLSVWLIAYGVATQALLHPNDPRIDWVFRRALYRPYLHIFGQIPLEEIDAARFPDINCTNEPEEIIQGLLPPCPNLYANWLVILLLVIFLLVTNVLLLNLLIAMFSYTFQVVQGNTDIFWKFQRYNLIVEYYSRPALAPPFIIISHISQLFLCMVKRPESKQEHLERELPAGLDQRLITWETVQKENYLAKVERQHWESSEERLKSTSSKVQNLLKIVGRFKDQEKRLVSVESQVRYCAEVLSWMAECFTKSTLKCEKDAPKAPTSLTGTKADSTAETSQSHQEQEARQKEEESKPGHPGYGANKKFPYIDE